MAQEISRTKKSSQNVERAQQGPRADLRPAYSPFGLMRRLADDMDRMFEGFGLPSGRHFRPWGWTSGERSWPELEILERNGKLMVRADLPGMNKDEILEITFDAPETAGNRRRIQIGEETVGGKKGETAA